MIASVFLQVTNYHVIAKLAMDSSGRQKAQVSHQKSGSCNLVTGEISICNFLQDSENRCFGV